MSYTHLADHYDALFRLNPALVAFLKEELGGLEGRRVVDAGCGTGTLGRALANDGAHVLGVDLDESLLAKAMAKAAVEPAFDVRRDDLRTFEASPGWDGILCLGNTLPHLPSEEEVARFFRHAHTLLAPFGKLVLQLIPLGEQLIRQLPLLETPEVRFRRTYAPLPHGNVRFTTTLEDRATGRSTQDEVELLALQVRGVEQLLAGAGFSRCSKYGGWDRTPWQGGASACIWVAQKG